MDKPSQSFYLKSRFVEELTPESFDSTNTAKLLPPKMGKSVPPLSVILFYCAWCPYCVKSKELYESFAKAASYARVCAFNCEKYKNHCEAIKNDMPGIIQGYPSIVFYGTDGQPKEVLDPSERTMAGLLKASMRICPTCRK